ncbi:MAG TPA: helix-turn-helix transcriptional regulator [Planctomicrobium sp.]|nr:helix-turn-helix transcriptional regulator [Planctomicrobium sp.]
MVKKKPIVKHAEIVERFAVRLRELRSSRGMTQAELAHSARVTASYVWRLEAGKVAPGIDLVQRLASALNTSVHELLPVVESPNPLPALQEQARKLFEQLMENASQEDLLMICPLLARLGESPTRRR